MSARSAPNPQIGTVPCPVVGCSETCTVRRFATRAQSDASRRQAGKLYCDCKVHGRFGFDGKEGMQDYILENGDLWGSERTDGTDEHPKGEPAAASTSAAPPTKPPPPAPPKPAPTSEAPASTSAAKPKKEKFNLWV